MTIAAILHITEIEQRVCDVTSIQLSIPRDRIAPSDRLIEDLNCDSLDLIELLQELEELFGVTLSSDPPNAIYKVVFTRNPFRLSDLAELVYLQQGTGAPAKIRRGRSKVDSPPSSALPFSQLDGRWAPRLHGEADPFEPLGIGPTPQFRRRSDGMRCVLIPAAKVEIGCDAADSAKDERPRHVVEMDSFLIDAEPVSTLAFCRFLNSIEETRPAVLTEWFALTPDDDRGEHMLIENSGSQWRPIAGAEQWPMILVSWHGANAYSLWANGAWLDYRCDADSEFGSFLPTEAQWEYAARGPVAQAFPWGDDMPTPNRMNYGQHVGSQCYQASSLPLAAVNAPLGMSPFGLHHMAGNVWQWCRDWYDETFYQKPESTYRNPMNQRPTQVRSERGGSWVGPAALCRSSYRRGRTPAARGRCLGFRCVSSASALR